MKYRIKQVSDGFIPQYKRLFWWNDLGSYIYENKQSALELIKFDYYNVNRNKQSVFYYVNEEDLND